MDPTTTTLIQEEADHSAPPPPLDGPDASSPRDKRPVENGAQGDSEDRSSKRPRFGPANRGDLKKVAEIVLALSTMAKIRGAKTPTDFEVGLVAEARAMLVALCEGLAPKDIVARDAIGAVIEDLGLNGKLKEQRLGFRGPKLTIAERFSQTKKKVCSLLLLIIIHKH